MDLRAVVQLDGDNAEFAVRPAAGAELAVELIMQAFLAQ